MWPSNVKHNNNTYLPNTHAHEHHSHAHKKIHNKNSVITVALYLNTILDRFLNVFITCTFLQAQNC